VNRFHGLDACRAAAMMLGLFFHGAISFMHTSVPWAIRDRSTHLVTDAFVWITHQFRMPVFFLLAGFFGRLVYEKLGPSGFVRHRARRLLLPFVVMLVPIVPSLYLLWKWGLAKGGPRATLGFGSGMRVPNPEVILRSPGHLWFLYYLLLLVALLALLVTLSRRVPMEGVKRGLDRVVRVLVRFRLTALALALPTAATLAPMEVLSADTPVNYVPQGRILAYYAVFAGFGWLLHRQTDLVEQLGRHLWVPLVLAVALIAPAGKMAERMMLQGPATSTAERLSELYVSALLGWSLVLLFLGAFVRWGARPRPWVAWLSDASYWCYLVHLPVVVALQVLVSDLAWPGPLKYALVMAGTIAFCLGTYQAFVRYTFVGAMLNGPRERPPAAPAPVKVPAAQEP
jgi:peptidoglycan/LPS O-acetylase OafA/YrhL